MEDLALYNDGGLVPSNDMPLMEVTDISIWFNRRVIRNGNQFVEVEIDVSGTVTGIVIDPKHPYFEQEIKCDFKAQDIKDIKEKMISIIQESDPFVDSISVCEMRSDMFWPH